MVDRRRMLLAAAGVSGGLGYLGLSGESPVTDGDDGDHAADASTDPERPEVSVSDGVAANVLVADTVAKLGSPAETPAVAVTGEGWAYWAEAEAEWRQFPQGSESNPVPSEHVRHQRARWINGTAYVPPGAGSKGIQAAIDALGDGGGEVRLLPGRYYCDTEIRIDKPNVRLFGAGAETVLGFSDGFDSDLLIVEPGSYHAHLGSFTIDGNRANNESGNCIRLRGYNFRPVIEHVTIRNAPGNGVTASSDAGKYTYEPVLEHVVVKNVDLHGFNLGYVADLYGANLFTESTGGMGFRLFGAGSTIYHPHVYDARGEAGIGVAESSQDTHLVGAFVDRNHRHGVLLRGERIILDSSLVFDNSLASTGEYDGLVLDGATRCIVTSNALVNFHGRDRQRYGVTERGAAEKNVVALNQFADNAAGGVNRETESDSQFALNVE
jgi:hypothetical protein